MIHGYSYRKWTHPQMEVAQQNTTIKKCYCTYMCQFDCTGQQRMIIYTCTYIYMYHKQIR